MTWRFFGAVSTALVLAAAACVAAADAPPSVRYVPLDAPAGASQAVIVDRAPLAYTRQLLPLDRDGKLVGEGSAEKQSEQVVTNLEAALGAAGSGLNRLVRVNVCALSHEAADCDRAQLQKRLAPGVRPAVTTILSPLPHRKALVAVDAVAVAADKGPAVFLARCDSLAGSPGCADAAVLPPGGTAYLSGQPERGGLTTAAVPKSLSALFATLARLKLSAEHVVQLRVFLTPASSAEETLAQIKPFFPDRPVPPVVFVEWIASAPVEIELVARLPQEDAVAEPLQLYNPPDVRPSPAFSRAALVRTPRQIFIAGLSAREAGDGEAQARDVFAQLQQVLAEAGGDLGRLAKATYCVSNDDASSALNKVRSDFLDAERPPAASKVMVHGVGRAGRTLTVDMIAVGSRLP